MENFVNNIVVNTFDSRCGSPRWEHREIGNSAIALMALINEYRIAVSHNKDYQWAEIRAGRFRFVFEAGKEPVFENCVE